MLKSTSSSTTLALSSSPSSCTLNSVPKHIPKSPIIASSSAHNLQAQFPPHPHHHPALVFPHQFHTHPHLESSHHTCHRPIASTSASTSSSATRRSGTVCESSTSSHSFSSDTHCYTTDCSPRSVIHPAHSSSSGPSPDPSRPIGHSPTCISSARTPRSKSHNLAAAASSSITRPHYPPIHGRNAASSLDGQHKQIMIQNHPHCYPPWRSPAAEYHHQCCLDASSRSLSASSERSYTTVGLVQSVRRYSGHDADTKEEGNNPNLKMKRSPKLVHKEGPMSVGLQRAQQCKPGYSYGSAAVDKPCVNIESKETKECDLGFKEASAMEARIRRNDTESGYICNPHLHTYTGAPISLNDSLFSSVQLYGADHKQRIPQNQSYSCDLANVKGGSRTSSRQSTGSISQQAQHHNANASLHRVAPKSSDALLYYDDGTEKHDHHPSTKEYMQLGSKWEDAEKWLRPASHPQHHSTGCGGFIQGLGLLRRQDCMNAGAVIKPTYINPLPVNAPCTADYVSAPSNCALATTANSVDHGLHAANSLQQCSRSAVDLANMVVNHPSLATRQFHHVDCFHPHWVSCNSSISHITQCYPAPQHPNVISNQGMFVSRLCGTNQQQCLGHDGKEKASQDQHFYQYGSSDSCMLKSTNASSEKLKPLTTEDNYRVMTCDEKNQGSNKLITDRFASGEQMSCSSTQLGYAKIDDKSILMGCGAQGSVSMPMVSLREVGTQMSSVDGSGSISRYTSKNGSPQKGLSPARHNTPARLRSLSGSASNSGNMRQSVKQLIDLEELVKCHRAKLELQELSEGERIHSFHRTTSNWSSREVEEADLSRSLRHSTQELENQSTTSFSHQWPIQSYSWNKDDDTRLAKLQLKEAKIQAWEDKKKSKADAKIKRLEENLAKKRSQTTTRIMESLAAAQRKAEEMRATVYAQQRRPIKKGPRLRQRSLSPLSRCTCFSGLQ